MQVIDREKSEIGQQRRKENGRLLHCCCICGKLSVWDFNWIWYGSEADVDGGVPIAKFCSSACQSKGGIDAELVTVDMRRGARDAEWREPQLAFRPAREIEKYQAALSKQRRK